MPKRRARHQKANPRKRAKDTATFDLLSWRVEEPVAPNPQEMRNVSDAGNVREGRELLLWMASNSRQWDPVTRVFRSFLVQRAAGTYSRDAYRGHLDAVVKDAAVAFRRAHPGAAHRFSPTTQAMVVDHILYDFETHHGNAPLTRR